MLGKRCFVTSMGKASISDAHTGVMPLRIAAKGNPPIPVSYTHLGTGGNNVPLVEQDSNAICIAGNIVDRQPQNGGNGLGCQDDLAYTLTATDRLSGYPDK